MWSDWDVVRSSDCETADHKDERHRQFIALMRIFLFGGEEGDIARWDRG